jgi:putative tryptophan/tyrosine transport system substrate-binding protein
VRRREVVALVALQVACPGMARAQLAGKSHRVGVLGAGFFPAPDYPLWLAFKEGLRDLGYVEGDNLLLDTRFADGNVDRLPALARELADSKPELIVVFGPGPMRAAKDAAGTTPIVMAAGSSDPVGEGYIASFARPRGNVTGLTYAVSSERFGKQLELLKEAVGNLSRVAMLWDGDLELFRRSWAPAAPPHSRR